MVCRRSLTSGTLPHVNEGRRVAEVQSLRAFAILLVAGYHYFASWREPIDWANLYPDTFAGLFEHTWLGVELFFMVSGFVISMTLLRSVNARHFLLKRVVRLWPALFVALPIVWLVGNLLGPDMYERSLSSLFTSFTLIDPIVINQAFPITVDWTTAVLWTMWIEIQFYLLAALLFFTFRGRFLPGLTALTGVSAVLLLVAELRPNMESLTAWLPASSAYLPWFLAGAIFHRIWTAGNVRRSDLLTLGSVFALESWWLWYHAQAGAIWLPVFFFLAFTAIVRRWRIARLLRVGGLVFLGEVSYEFYLVHDTIGVTVITQILDRFGFGYGPHLFGAALGFAVSLGIATIAYRLTTPLRRRITGEINRRMQVDQKEMTASS